jgi:hypothetical protein
MSQSIPLKKERSSVHQQICQDTNPKTTHTDHQKAYIYIHIRVITTFFFYITVTSLFQSISEMFFASFYLFGVAIYQVT